MSDEKTNEEAMASLLSDIREMLADADIDCLGTASSKEGMEWPIRDEVINEITTVLNKLDD